MQNLLILSTLESKRKTRNILLFLVFLFLFSGKVYAKFDQMLPALGKEAKGAGEGTSRGHGAKGSAFESIVVNGDVVEFSTEQKEIVATGNVEVNYKGATLTCDKLTVNNGTKDGVAEGHARLKDPRGIIVGSKIFYNFETKTGTIVDSGFRANPYFGRAEETEKVSEEEFLNKRGYITTCDFDNPHWRMKSKKMAIFPGDKIQTKDDTFYFGNIPFLYMPQFNRSLRDPLMHVQIMPGKSKAWGPYMLTAWRYNLTEDVTGLIYLDYRSSLGVAEGFGLNYTTTEFGKGDFKYYYTQERDKSNDLPSFKSVDTPKVFQRYLIRWRHKWDIDTNTNLMSEYYKIEDSKRALFPNQSPAYSLLSEYFVREYQQIRQPLSYVSVHRALGYSSLDFLMQPRTNRWYDEIEELPLATFSMPSLKIGDSPFYFTHSSQFANFNHKQAVPSSSTTDIRSTRFDTTNQISVTRKIAFVEFTPFIKHRGTYYKRNVYGSSNVFRTIFYSGASASTKFYRIFNIKTNVFHLDINDLRHIITPTISYSYNHMPTVASSKLAQIDSVDSLSGPSNSASLGVSNILQTKRNDQSVEVLNLLISTPYTFKSRGNRGSSLGDFSFNLNVIPYSWMSLVSTATFSHPRNRLDPNYNTFSNVNYDLNFNWGTDRTLGFGQRYQRKGPNEYIINYKWRLNPKWYFSIFNRFVEGYRNASFKRGLREQEYVLSRDLHCWIMDITYNVTRDKGESIFLTFRLKAFPELQFQYNQEYHQPKPGQLGYQ